MPVLIADVVDAPLDLQAHLDAVEDARQGATASVVGAVRNHDPQIDGEVTHLDYSAHPSASETMAHIASDVAARLDPDGVARIAVTHRVGRLGVGDIAIVAAVSSPHRALAFALCNELVEEVKRSLPIWKHQHNTDGDDVWSGLT